MSQPANLRLVTEAALDTAIPPEIRESLSDDTGLTNGDSLVVPDQGWNTNARVRIIRKRNHVQLSVLNIGRATASTTTQPFLFLPGTFRPVVDLYFDTWVGTRARILSETGELQLYSAPTTQDYLTLSWLTTRAYRA